MGDTSMMPYLLQMMQQGGGMGGGMPQMQNAAPQIQVAQGGQRSISPTMGQMPNQQQHPAGGAVGGAVQAGNNLQTLGKWGQAGYNAAFGSTAPNTGAQNPGTTFTGASPQSGMMNQQQFMGGQTPSMGMQYGQGGAPMNGASGYTQPGPISGLGSTGNNPFANFMQGTAPQASAYSGLPGAGQSQFGMYGGAATIGAMNGAQAGADGTAAGSAGSADAAAGGTAASDASAASATDSSGIFSYLSSLFA